jgi:carbamoyltransferase
MLLVASVAAERGTMGTNDKGLRGLDRLKATRSQIPAVTHVDGSARVKTFDPERVPRFAAILAALELRTCCPVPVNTSFNIRGEPIVHDACDAYRCFMFIDMDTLVIGNLLMREDQQPPTQGAGEHRRSFKLD